MRVSVALLARIAGAALLVFGLTSAILTFSFWPNFWPYTLYIPLAIVFLGLGTALYLWGLLYRQSPRPEPLISVWIVAAEVVGSFLVLLALYENALVYIFTGERAADVSSAAVLVPLGLGVVLWGFAIVLERALVHGRKERARIEGNTPSGQTPPSETSTSFARDPEGVERVRRMYGEIALAVRNLSAVTQSVVRQATILTTIILALIGLLVLRSVEYRDAPDGVATLVAYCAIAVAILYVFGWAWLGWLTRVRRDLGTEHVPAEPFPSWTPLAHKVARARPSSEGLIGVPPAQGDSSTLAKSISLLGLGHRLEELAQQSLTWIFLGVLLAGSLVGYLLAWSFLVRVFGPSSVLSYFNLFTGVAWLTAGVIATLSFLLLHRMCRPIARINRTLTSLELEEIELERAFWSRF